MKQTQLLACLLVSAAVSIDLVVLTGFKSHFDTSLMLYLGLAIGQLALLAIWCSLASGAWFPRCLAAMLAAMLVSVPLGAVTAVAWAEWFLLLSCFTVAVALAALFSRWYGLRATIITTELAGGFHRQSLRVTQYSLGGLLSVMTAAGVLLGVSRHLTLPTLHTPAMVSYGLWLTIVAIASLWAVASPSSICRRTTVLASVCIAAGLLMCGTERAHNVWFFTMIAFIEAIVVCFGISFLGAGGLRIGRQLKAA